MWNCYFHWHMRTRKLFYKEMSLFKKPFPAELQHHFKNVYVKWMLGCSKKGEGYYSDKLEISLKYLVEFIFETLQINQIDEAGQTGREWHKYYSTIRWWAVFVYAWLTGELIIGNVLYQKPPGDCCTREETLKNISNVVKELLMIAYCFGGCQGYHCHLL